MTGDNVLLPFVRREAKRRSADFAALSVLRQRPPPSDSPRCKTSPAASRWDIEDNGACFIARDHRGQVLCYVFRENEPGRRAAAGLLTRDEARRLAINIAKLPELLRRPPPW
jgi:hypothetical protein